MTTSTTTPRLSYTADGSTAAFTFNFEIADSSSIDVYVGSTLKTLTTDYTVSFDSGTSGTGTVTFTSAPSSGTVTLVRDTNLARTTDFENSGAFLASTVNAELDRLSQAVIDATDKVETKAILLAEPTTETPTLTLPDAATRASKVLSFDGSGDLQVSAAGTGSVTSVGLTTSGNDLTITNSPVTTSGNINIEMANPITVNVTGDVTGNASTATALATARTIAGQSFDGTGNITIASTDLSNTSNITLNDASQTLTNKSLTSPTITGTGAIAGTFTGNIAGDVTGNITASSGTSTLNNLFVSGDLTVEGTNTIINTDTIAVEDNILLLNRNVSGTPSVDAGIEVERGTSANKQFIFDESEDKWSIAGETLIAGGIQSGSITTVSNGDITLAPNGSGRILLTPGTNGVQVTTGNFSVNAGYLESEGVRINDNIISTTRSNDNLILDPAGTGSITLNSAVTTGGAVTVGGDIAMGGNTITGLDTAAPSADSDVANKKYVDDSVSGLPGNTISQLNSNIQVTDTGTNGKADFIMDGSSVMDVTSSGLLLGSGQRVTTILDQDGMTSNSDTALATQQSIRAFVEAQVATGDITFTGSTINSPSNADITLNPGGTGAIAMPGITINDNNITATRSNDNLNLVPGGSGSVVIEDLKIAGDTITGSDPDTTITMNDQGVSVNGPINSRFVLDASSGVSGSNSVYCSDNSTTEYKANPSYAVGMKVNAIGGGGSSGGEVHLRHNTNGHVKIQKLDTADSGVLKVGTIEGTDTIDSQSNSLYLGGTGLAVSNNGLTATGTSNFNWGSVNIQFNEIKTNVSNADLELSANGSGTVSINGLKFPTSDGSANQVLKTDGSGNLSFVAQSAGTTLSGSTNNTITTVTGADAIQGEANLTFDGTTLGVAGNITATTSIENDAIRITDNTILGLRSNDNITITPAGTGSVAIAKAAITGGTITGITDLEVADGGTGASSLTNNAILTGNGTSAIVAEPNASFDGTNFAITGAITATTSIANDAISIDDNVIKTTRSNDNLFFQANGTGHIQLEANGGEFTNFSSQSRYDGGNRFYYEKTGHTAGVDRDYRNAIVSYYQLTAGQTSSSSNDRYRNMANMKLDVNGSTLTSASGYLSRGPMALSAETDLVNTSSSDAAIKSATGVQGGVYVNTSGSGDLTVSGTNSGVAGSTTWMDVDAASGTTITVDNGYGFYSTGLAMYGSGTKNVTNFYHFFANASSNDPTDEYAFYTENPLMESAVGTLEQYREKINALTSSSTITVDCSLAPVHRVVLATNTGFNFKNLATGQTCMLVIKQDGTGSRTATFTEEDSTAILFPGGQPTLSTAANAVDVLTFFNTGSEVIGNCVKAYAAS